MGDIKQNDGFGHTGKIINNKKIKRFVIIGIVIIFTIGISIGLTMIPSKVLSGSSNTTNNNEKPMITHIHPNIVITVDGKQESVPADIGMSPLLWKDHSLDSYGMQEMAGMGMPGMAPLHTHDNSGTIHVESSDHRDYTVDKFLNIWGGLNVDGNTISATVNGKPVSNYKNIILKDGEQINLQINSP